MVVICGTDRDERGEMNVRPDGWNRPTRRRNVSVNFSPRLERSHGVVAWTAVKGAINTWVSTHNSFIATYWTPPHFAALPCIHFDDRVIGSACLIIPAVLPLQRWQPLIAFSHAEVTSRLPPTTMHRPRSWCGVCPTVRWYSMGFHSQIALLFYLYGDVNALEACFDVV